MHFPSFTMVVSLKPSHFTIHPSSRSRACSKVQGRVLHGTHIREIQPGTILDEQLDLGQCSLQQIPYRYTNNRSRYVHIGKYTYPYYLCMYVCMYECMYVCIYIYVCGWMDGWMDGWMHVRTYVRMYDYVRMYVWMYVCMYVCIYVCIVYAFRGFSWLTTPGFETMLVGLTLHQLIHTSILKKW